MAFRRDRVRPTHYPKLPFHIIRSAQLLSSTVVACIMFYFLKELAKDNFRLPWTFILLVVVSLLTIFSLTTTIVLHCFYGLNPVLNTLLNSGLALLWAVSFSLLSWWSSGTLSHVCSRDNWDSELGMSVCRLYKALFSFSLLGLLSTLVALVLDVHVQRQATARGRFQQIGLVAADGKGARTEGHRGLVGHETNPNPNSSIAGQMRGGEGYALPDEQFAYGDDTTYHGAAGQVGRRSLEERM
ncbi:hypothetical protein CC86DRAFT_467700 [Ophiobolus disseminans]|uniref:MARVEL domain-containing protein n=1 Tax=Ophiobolus disseminans TaxID=1469910 RepID=A0A6A6ZXR0_9PLEO|nr:hypothetical protein CC86DRAFT_467700 [Ophiobolus disseminans]